MHGTSQGTPVPLSTFGGLATIADPNSLPEGASPRTYDTDFDVGSVFTRDGLTNAYTYAGATVGPNGGSIAVGAKWASPNAVLLNDGSYASVQFTLPPRFPGIIDPLHPPSFLDITGFGFDLPATAAITGITVQVHGFGNAPGQCTVGVLLDGHVYGSSTQDLPTSEGVTTFGSSNTQWGRAWTPDDINNSSFGVSLYLTSAFTLGIGFLDWVSITIGLTTGAANFNWIGTFTNQDAVVRNLSLDANGDLWKENVTTTPGVLNLALTGITPNSYCVGVNGEGVEYLAFNDLTTGSDVPRQYTPQWIDKISQVGPGASPVFSSSSGAGITSYDIAEISQPPAKSWGFAFLLQSAGPGSNSPGNVVTVYYADSTLESADADLVNAFNDGTPLYIYLQFTPSHGGDTVGALVTPYTALVTSVNVGKPNGQSRPFYYFTYQVENAGFVWNPGQNGAAVTYQRTQATLTMAQAVPLLVVGDKVNITGSPVAPWDATWPIVANFNSGQMAISQTALSAAGVGTYSYTVTTGGNPAAGQLVTVTGTLNANGQLNVSNVPIASVSGTTGGTFTVNLLPAGTDFPAQAENGQATTAGTLFGIDPGANTIGSGTNPIYGNASGGSLTVSGSGQVVGSGTRQGTVFFITRNGYWTSPAPPVSFTTPDNTTTINASNIPIGPPNVIGRGIAFTEPGQNGIPGANFFTIPTNVNYIVQNTTYTATSLIIWDNTTTQASFNFTDDVLLNAEAIDVQGNNLFNLIEIGNPGWIVQYDSRNFYGLCQNKVQNFNNLSFDGGYLNPGNPTPLGWNSADQYGRLILSPVFGSSYYIQNTSPAGIGGGIGIITQSAFQDAYQQPIILPNTTYSVRVTCRHPGSVDGGGLVVGLTTDGGGSFYGSFDMPLSSMTSQMATYIMPLLTAPLATVPSDLQLMVYLQNPDAGADVEIDRIEIFPTDIPVLTNTVYGSYANDFESVDAVTGQVKFISENQQPVNGAVVMYDTFYALKESSMYSLRSVANLEPAQWDEPEVAQRAGACGLLSYDFGEQWIVTACRNGLYLYEGGQPGRIMPEIYQIWNAINWAAKDCIWVKNDVPNSRLFLGIPLPTPNFWLPNAPVNTNPTTPNVILMCNYKGVSTGEGIKAESAVHVTMFGTLEAGDMRRKWSLWNIASPYGSFVTTPAGPAFYICNGNQSSKIFKLDPNNETDDGNPINSLYTTFGFVNLSKAGQYPMLGFFRKRWAYLTATLRNTATATLRFLGDTLLGPTDSTAGYNSWTVPGGFSPMPVVTRDRESTANFVATRTFLEFSGTDFELSNVTFYGRKDIYNPITGQK